MPNRRGGGGEVGLRHRTAAARADLHRNVDDGRKAQVGRRQPVGLPTFEPKAAVEAEERGAVVLRVLDVVVGIDEARLRVALQRAAFVHKGDVFAARLVCTRRVKG